MSLGPGENGQNVLNLVMVEYKLDGENVTPVCLVLEPTIKRGKGKNVTKRNVVRIEFEYQMQRLTTAPL